MTIHTVRHDATDIEVVDWCWLDVDCDERERLDEDGAETGVDKLGPDERWCVIRGVGHGGRWHHGPTMAWSAWVALSRAVLEEYGSLAPDAHASLSGGGLVAGSRMAMRPCNAHGLMWSAVSPRNGQFASCEGTLTEVIGLARSILEWNDEGWHIARSRAEKAL